MIEESRCLTDPVFDRNRISFQLLILLDLLCHLSSSRESHTARITNGGDGVTNLSQTASIEDNLHTSRGLSVPNPQYRSGSFLVDTNTGEISRDGMRLKLRPQAFQVLGSLMARPGELVTREELIKQIWGQDTFVDYEQGLNFCVREVRKVLGDDADVPKYVETLARRGYRFIGPVEVLDLPGSKPEPAPIEPAKPVPVAQRSMEAASAAAPAVSPDKPRGTSRWAGIAAIVIVCVTVPLVAWLYRGGSKPRHMPPRIVVLPFANLTGNAQQEYLVRGVVEEITAQLGAIDPSSLAVIGRTSAEAISTHNYTVDEIARQLDVDYVVEGSVRQQNDQLRITAQLIRSSDMAHVWAESYNRDAMKLFTVEEQVAASIVREINLALGRDAKHSAAKRGSVSAEAMDEYLRGRDAKQRFVISVSGQSFDPNYRDDYAVAERHLRRAIELDPKFALAHADLADLLVLKMGVTDQQGDPDWEGSEATAQKALELDPDLPEANIVMARIMMLSPNGNLQDAKRFVDRAMALNPSSPQTLIAASNYYMISGDLRAGMEVAEKFARLEPMDIRSKQSLAYAYYMNGRYSDSIANARGVLEKSPTNFSVLMTLTHACFLNADMACMLDAYLKVLQASVETDPSDVSKRNLTDAMRVYQQGGGKALLEYVHGAGREAFLNAPDRNRGIRMLLLGENTAAIDFLEKLAADPRNLRSLRVAGYDPLLKPLENDPRGRAVLEKIRLH